MSLRIGHTGDLHLTQGARFADTARALDWIAEDGAARGVGLWLVGGDLVGTHEVPHVATVQERNFLDVWFQRLAATAPVLILYGNHDVASDMLGYGRLDATHPITVVTEPRVVAVRAHPLDPDVATVAHVVCLPYPHKRLLLDCEEHDDTIKGQNLAAADVLRRLLADYASLDLNGVRILFGHLTIRGCHLSGDEILANKEVELTTEDLDAFPADVELFSHIHLHQQVGARAWYAGSPTSQTFGETDEKGYVIVDVEPGAEPVITRRLTPARRLVTVQARWVQAGGSWQWLADPAHDLAAVPEGAEVRLQVEIPEEAATSCPVDELQARFADVAHTVVLERKYVPKQRVRSETIRSAQTNTDRLEAWWECLGSQAPKADQRDRLFAKLALAEQDIAGVVVAEAEEDAA